MLARVSVLLGRINPTLGELWGLQLCIFIVVTTLTGLFLIGYLLQGTRVGIQLWMAIRRIKALARTGKNVDPAAVAAVLTQRPLSELWQEYRDTLHEVKQQPEDGPTPLMELRATVPAQLFFTRDALVDGRLFDDFTRHLPGVLTGLGIIGTFAGLLEGLSRFDATSSTTAVAGLKSLLDGVAHAFTISAIAIGCAMLVVFVGKFALAIFYQQVESLNHLIDALYATGAGEEYLSRLVHSSEKSDAHISELKKELIEEFTRLLNTLSDRQIAANAQNTQALGRYLGEALKGSLGQMGRSTAAQGPSIDPAHFVVQDSRKRVVGARNNAIASEDMAATLEQISAALSKLEAPIAQLGHATVNVAGAVREIQSILTRMQKN
jgi:hypothetical protein